MFNTPQIFWDVLNHINPWKLSGFHGFRSGRPCLKVECVKKMKRNIFGTTLYPIFFVYVKNKYIFKLQLDFRADDRLARMLTYLSVVQEMALKTTNMAAGGIAAHRRGGLSRAGRAVSQGSQGCWSRWWTRGRSG
jgi:hypothetical protein